MDRQSVYSISVLPSDPDAVEDSRGQIQAQLRDFILEFRLDNAFIYRYDCPSFMAGGILTSHDQRSDSSECAGEAILLRC